jgi:serine/threonine protein kinase
VATRPECLALKASTDPERQKQLMNEAYFLLAHDHPNIIRAHGLYDLKISDQPGLGMLMDYKAGSDLSTWIPVDGLSESAVKGIMRQTCDALLYLHRRLIVHRDVKPSNVFCELGENSTVKVYLADFGFAAYVDERDKISKRCGSPGFIAPEIFGDAWTEMFSSDPQKILKTDVYSFGMLIYATALGVNPFIAPTLRQTYKNNARGIINASEASTLSHQLQDMLKWCTARNQSKRCSIIDIADHPWFHADLRALGFAGADDDMYGDLVSWAVFEEDSKRRRD